MQTNLLIISREALSPTLEIIRIVPEGSQPFPSYIAGQYITLNRNNGKLLRKKVDEHGRTSYFPDLDESGNQRRGKTSRSYSIASAPFETLQNGFIELYVDFEKVEPGETGEIREFFFQDDPDKENALYYDGQISGDFTLEQRAVECSNIVLIGSGTGIAPFVSMLKQREHDMLIGNTARYTLFHANRTPAELGFHNIFLRIAKEQKIDFVYIPTITRPTPEDSVNFEIGQGRGNNVLRSIFGMALKDEGREMRSMDELRDIIQPMLPRTISIESLRKRMDSPSTVFFVCGNSDFMNDVRFIAESNGMRFEMEEW